MILAGWRVARGVVLNIQEGLTASERLAQGDLATNIVVRRRDEIGQMLIAMNSVYENLRRIVGDVQEATEAVGAAAVQVAQGSADLAQRTEKQAAALGETASSMEQLTSAVQSNADSAVQAEHLASVSRDQAEQGGVIIEQLANSISEINASSSQIVNIIGVIDEIAFQTNLLALNAAVEAARAGEQGRGFAVVAGEVRKLAQRRRRAADQVPD